jgi:Flp pilus assembly protein TadD
MSQSAHNARFVTLAVTTALATSALAGCTTSAAPSADLSAGKAQTALAKGQPDKALTHAEAAVLAEPRDASYRAMLGASYMEAGRFHSAATSFGDAMALGDTGARTALSLSLAQIASGDVRSARALLDNYRDDIDAADLGLAMALAGDANQGVHILSNAIRGGQNNAKTRQNLAYAYALKGDWRSARLMAAEDVPGNQINDRISEWASTSSPGDFHRRVAKLLEVPLVRDSGQPAQLALANTPSKEQMFAEAAAEIPVAQPSAPPEWAQATGANTSGELPALAKYTAAQSAPAAPIIAAPAPASAEAKLANFSDAFEAPKSAASPEKQYTQRFNSSPAVQAAPARSATVLSTSRGPTKAGDHLIQLGSFSSKENAQRATGIYAKRYAHVDQYEMVISEARVNGKTYWRVSAGDMSKSDARSMCSSVKASGFECIAYAASSPLPGSVDSSIRMARR